MARELPKPSNSDNGPGWAHRNSTSSPTQTIPEFCRLPGPSTANDHWWAQFKRARGGPLSRPLPASEMTAKSRSSHRYCDSPAPRKFAANPPPKPMPKDYVGASRLNFGPARRLARSPYWCWLRCVSSHWCESLTFSLAKSCGAFASLAGKFKKHQWVESHPHHSVQPIQAGGRPKAAIRWGRRKRDPCCEAA